jgi:hypothetical protein
MDKFTPNEHVVNPKVLLKKEEAGITKFNTALALKITNTVGSMWTAYLFGLLSLFSLPAILVLVSPHLKHFFPHWIVAASLISLIAWVSQNFLQLVLLPVIMVGQNVIQGQQDAKADADHRTLTFLANLQEEQMTELKNQGEILEFLKKELKP